MKRKRTYPHGCALFIMALFSLLIPQKGMSHGTGFQLLSKERTITVAFHYSDGTPMRYAELYLFGPGDQTVEYQNGRTDAKGHFSFCPDRPGQWTLKVNDGRGHAVHATVRFDDEASSDQQREVSDLTMGKKDMGEPIWLRLLFGLSVIVNVFAIPTVFRKKQTI